MRKPVRKKLIPKNLTRNFVITLLILLVFGLIMIYDATSVHSQSVYGTPYKFVLLQFVWTGVGFLGFLFFFKLDYRKFSPLAYIIFFVSLISLLFLAVASRISCGSGISFAPCINGANRWVFLNPSPLPEIPFLGVLGFQPAELAKLGIVLYLSYHLSFKTKKEEGFSVYLFVTLLISCLIVMQPNLSTAIIVYLIGTTMYFSTGFKFFPVLISFVFLLLISLVLTLVSPYRLSRLRTHIGNSTGEELKEDYHSRQVSIALGSGGIFGMGFGQSRQKYQYLPEVASDSIFAIIGEELGLIGTVLLISTFTFFLFLGFQIGQNATDTVGRLLVVGVTSWMGFQFFINVAAMVRLIPLTGVPMPLVSYGGSSMVFSLIGLGIVANISKHSRV